MTAADSVRLETERLPCSFGTLVAVNRVWKGRFLSVGEPQMLAIARGVVARPKIMLVDEPTEGPAPLLVQSLTGILRELNQRGTTIPLTEQTLEVAMALSHRLYMMDQGRIQFEGTPDALRKEPTIQQRLLQL